MSAIYPKQQNAARAAASVRRHLPGDAPLSRRAAPFLLPVTLGLVLLTLFVGVDNEIQRHLFTALAVIGLALANQSAGSPHHSQLKESNR